jgi:hypothetical protein
VHRAERPQKRQGDVLRRYWFIVEHKIRRFSFPFWHRSKGLLRQYVQIDDPLFGVLGLGRHDSAAFEVNVQSAQPYLYSTGIFKEAVIDILAAVAKQERVRLSERTIVGLQKAKAQGQVGGRPKG